MEQKHNSLLYNYLLESLKYTLGPRIWDFAISDWAESDEKGMWWKAGNLITGSLPTETQPAYLLSQGTSNLHWLGWFFPGAYNKRLCPAEIRSWQRRLCTLFFYPGEYVPFFQPSLCQILLGSQPLLGCNLDTTKCKSQKLLPGQYPGGSDTLT